MTLAGQGSERVEEATAAIQRIAKPWPMPPGRIHAPGGAGQPGFVHRQRHQGISPGQTNLLALGTPPSGGPGREQGAALPWWPTR